ncbi:uncharacterized protein BO97DRAFT_435677 [Aspergillus homomorphus CBS 101889]|uniref:Phytase-like domain-containing protein n=1 Tax=Aspergillus homomorphus (strain CBS 101889) TaxID=1450537 RepID=A0A395HTB4_ASPHC|nr:hypothetical protein BO97DRAFT_435677 [Aspergillus homomorphus CBS 101889]RAL10796.1 hypothetical protein BO97DRAFT_435677 [Aspergillus homomorphus CBS 101889]
MATRTSTRQAAQKAKEAIAAAPDVKSRSAAGTKRKGSADKGVDSKRGKKEADKKLDDAQRPAIGTDAQAPKESKAEDKAEDKVEDKAEGKRDEQSEAKPDTKSENGAAEKAEEDQTEGKPEEKMELDDEKKPEDVQTENKDADTASAKGTEAGVETSQAREEKVPSNILEKGIIYFFYRSRVNVTDPQSVDDVARTFIVLRPTPLGATLDANQGSVDTGAKCRLMALPKKRFPTSGRERVMGFVEKSGQSMKALQESFIAGDHYDTATQGERTVPEARPYAEGVYAITSTKRTSHLAYVLTIPDHIGTLQEDFGLRARGSWVVQSKNPKHPGPSYAQLPKGPEYPDSVLAKFGDYRWKPVEPEFIDYPNAQFLVVGEAVDELGKAATAEEDGKKADEATTRSMRIWDSMRKTILPFRQPGRVSRGSAAGGDIVNQTSCGSHTYAYTGLAGYGFIPSNATDKYGDTLGGFGSSAAFDLDSWRRIGPETYTGILYCIPDRGWNTNGTLNYQARVHTLNVTLHLAPDNISAQHPSPPNLQLTYLDTLLLTDPTGNPLTGLDASADFNDTLKFPGFPPLPAAIYRGNGFDSNSTSGGGHRVSLDAEGLALTADSFWISDEYGPYVYRFDRRTGRMKTAIAPPPAYIPHRNQTISFSADSAPIYDPKLTAIPKDPVTGRANNQGFEALTLSPDGKTLYTMIQSALDQEGGGSKKTRRPARLLQYDLSSPSGTPVYEHEYVVMLPTYYNPSKGHDVVAAQSEIHLLPQSGKTQDKTFLVLARDSGFGHGQDKSLSVYRHADIVRITSNTTDLKRWRGADAVNGSIASAKGVLDAGITPAEYCSFLDFNVNEQLAKFGLHNGGDQDDRLLNEKWESLALVPVEPGQQAAAATVREKEYFLFSLSDNDFITQDGRMNFGRFRYADDSGYNLDNQALVFRVKIPV